MMNDAPGSCGSTPLVSLLVIEALGQFGFICRQLARTNISKDIE